MKYPPPMPMEVVEVASIYNLLQNNVSVTEQGYEFVPAELADKLLMLDGEVKEYEEAEMNRGSNKK